MNDSDSDSDSDILPFLGGVDLSKVSFDERRTEQLPNEHLWKWEQTSPFELKTIDADEQSHIGDVIHLSQQLADGNYSAVLRHERTNNLLGVLRRLSADDNTPIMDRISQTLVAQQDKLSDIDALVLEMLAIAAFNLFLQANYTGPMIEEEDEAQLSDVNPHPSLSHVLQSDESDSRPRKSYGEEKKDFTTVTKYHSSYHNSVLAELAVDGDLPCQICNLPYYLLLARSILGALCAFDSPSVRVVGAHLWHARAIVAQERLLQGRQPSESLWKAVKKEFEACSEFYCGRLDVDPMAATVLLEYGLAEHHFDRLHKGKKSFLLAQRQSGLSVEVTGAEGVRTKYQTKATAQYLVKAVSAATGELPSPAANESKDKIKSQMVKHSEDGILLERIKFDDDANNKLSQLNCLDQSILLALCLDVKNNNPMDGLTGEEMGAFLSRVLEQHDDWMIYSTGLLERSWLEFERSHSRERALLQIQALVDQCTNRLTITQATRQSIEDSAPVQDRLKNLHSIVYPPRWAMLQGLADRYAELGVVTSAAELFTEIEYWDEVVECYRRAGKVAKAEQIVRERLAVHETPRMWSALGDLKKDPAHYQRAIELSKGRFSNALVSLANYHFDKGELDEAADWYLKALEVRPLMPTIWFRLGTVNMQLGRWDAALRAFSEVVLQEPEEAEAWANIAAIHMHNKQPSEAHPALVESLKRSRNNWRVWVSKLYTCLDLFKFNEAIEAANVILDLRSNRQAADKIPDLEEKCIRAIVGGSVRQFHESRDDKVALDGARRTLGRADALLERIHADGRQEPWVFETIAFLSEQIGQEEKMMDNLMMEYRTLTVVAGWEKDNARLERVCRVVSHISRLHMQSNTKDALIKAKFLVRGVLRKVEVARPDDSGLPNEIERLKDTLSDVETSINKL